MREYIDVTAGTEEEALRKGLEQLGLDRDEVSVEILERAKKGFLGFGAAPAKVRISYGEDRDETPEPVPVREPVQTEGVQSEPAGKPERRRGDRKPRQKARPEPTASPELTPAPAPSQPAEPEPAAPGETEEAPAPRQTDRPSGRKRGSDRRKQDRRAQEKREPAEPGTEEPVELKEADVEKSQAIKTFLSGLLEHMDTPADIKVYLAEGGRYKVLLEGSGMGALIGRRGETLDAIQQLTSYAVNRTGNRVRIQLDAEGYREKREQSLRRLARKTAAKVVKTRRSFTLEPMNAYERHVIHTALQDFSGVTTYSTGVDPNRRVIVAYDRENA